MINKGCEANYLFENGFILGEEHMITISSMIKERYSAEELLYRITKSNSYIFQTSDVKEIFKEENSNANLINKLEIIIDDDNINFYLCFEKGEDSFLRIIGTDKDKIFLLYNEVKTYVEKEVAIVKTFLRYDMVQSISSTISMVLLLGCLFFSLTEVNHVNTGGIESALNSSDVLVKLNYIINQQSENKLGISKYSYSLIPIMFISLLLMFLPRLLMFFWGKKGVFRITDYFLVGKQKNVYDKKIKIKNNIIWTVGIGFLVSIVAGLLVYIFTK